MNEMDVVGHYEDILSVVMRFRVLHASAIHSEMDNVERSCSSTVRGIRKLVKGGFLKENRSIPGNRNYYYPTPKTISGVFGDKSLVPIDDELIRHEVCVSNVIRGFSSLGLFDGFRYEDYFIGEGIKPDGVLNLGDKRFALEVELTQKELGRIESKLRSYLDSSSYSSIFYIFDKKSVLAKYVKVLESITSNHQHSRIIMFYLPTMIKGSFDLLNCNTVFRNSICKFNSILTDLNINQ